MDNAAIARIFEEIADLLEIKGANPFKIRAYRNAADTIGSSATAFAGLTDAELRQVPGIGKDLAGRLREILETGASQYHGELAAEFPPTILDLLRLQGVGPKTVALLYSRLEIQTLDDLEAAARSGRLRELKGMGARKEELILKALEDRRRYAGRHLLAEAHDTAAALIEYLRETAPDIDLIPVGSLRRGCETCGDLDILAISDEASSNEPPSANVGPIMDRFVAYGAAERVLARGPTKSSIALRGGFQVDLRLVARASRGAALQYFTGSKAHNIALRDRALHRGFKLNEYGLYRVADDALVAGATEEDLYHALGLAFVPPELRENRGELEAAASGALPALVERSDLRGDLHMHSTETDGRDDAETMARAARAAGLEYIAITDHSKAVAMANGLDERRALEHARAIRALNDQIEGITVLAGIECDIRPDGTLDLEEDCLAQLDLVIASVHSNFTLDEAQMTERVLRAIASPVVDVIGHPTGRLILRREPYRLNLERVIEAAAARGVALEINSQIDRLDLGDVHARLARDRGARLVVSTDAHSQAALNGLRWGLIVARRAWLAPTDILNTQPLDALKAGLRRNRP